MRWRLRFVCNPASYYCSTIDNLAVAHGRRESRARRTAPKSVRAPALDPGEQIKLRDRLLAAFTG